MCCFYGEIYPLQKVMNGAGVEFDRLKMFVAIVEEGSLTGAAKRLHITQPAVSRSLKLLEEHLGVDLFDRVGRGLEITAAGRALLPRAHEVLQRMERVEREVQLAARQDLFSLRLGTTDSVATYLLPGIIDPLREDYPGLELQWCSKRSAELLRDVREGDLDAVVVAAINAPADRHVSKLGAYHMGYYGRRDRFEGLLGITHEEELDAFPLIELEALPGQPTLIGEHTSSFARVSSLATVKALVMGGFGVGALLDFMLEPTERASLYRAPLVHDPDCGLFLVTGEHFSSEREQELMACVSEQLTGVLSQRQQGEVH